MKTDIAKLHKLHLDNLGILRISGRRIGKTLYLVHSIIGHIMVTDSEDVIVVVNYMQRAVEISRMIAEVARDEYGLETKIDLKSRRIFFDGCTSSVKILTPDYYNFLSQAQTNRHSYLYIDFGNVVSIQTVLETLKNAKYEN